MRILEVKSGEEIMGSTSQIKNWKKKMKDLFPSATFVELHANTIADQNGDTLRFIEDENVYSLEDYMKTYKMNGK